jgi:hypothetical protein
MARDPGCMASCRDEKRICLQEARRGGRGNAGDAELACNREFESCIARCDEEIGQGKCVQGKACIGSETCYGGKCINGKCECGGTTTCTDADCVAKHGKGWHCENNVCVPSINPKECSTDAECVTKHGAGWTCSNGYCVPPPNIQCSETKPCPTGYECKNGYCVPIPEPNCIQDKYCTTDEICGKGKCVRNKCECYGGCNIDSDCPTGKVCKNNKCEKKGDGDGDGDHTCTGDSDCPAGQKCFSGICKEYAGEFAWSPETQALLARILDRANSLLDQPLGLSDEERQAIYNRIFEKIKGTERPAIQSAMNVTSRQGLLGSPYAERGVTQIQRSTREQLSAAERDIQIQEAQDRYQQLLGTTEMAQSLLGTGMSAEQLVEAANAARRGEGTSSLNSILQYLISVGGQNSTYYQALLNWLTTHSG